MTYDVLIIDRSELIRVGLKKALAQAISVGNIHQTNDPCSLCQRLEKDNVDLLLCNTSFYREIKCELLKQEDFKIYTIGIVTSTIDENVISYFDELIYLNDTIEKIAQKIEMLLEKEHQSSSKAKPDISDRERDVLRLIAKGLFNKEISDQLFISIHTVITHRKNIAHKLGIKSASGLTVYAILNNLIAPDELRSMLK